MAFKIRNFYGSPLHSEGFTMDELNKKTKKEQAKSKDQALKLPQIEKPGFNYEMDQDVAYPGGERGKEYNKEGRPSGYDNTDEEERTEKRMSRKASPLDAVGAHSMTSDKYASHLASASEHKAPSDEVIAKRKKEGKKTTGHISDKQPTNTPPKDGMSRKASPFNHRDKTGKPIQGPKKHSHSTPIDTSNLSYFTDQAKINSKNTDAKKKAKEETKKALIERKNKAKK